MAVLTGITGAVRANIAGAAQQAVRSAATGVKKIAGLPTEGGNSALGAASNLMGGTSSNILTYPIAVDTDPQQGHYILFHINTRKNGKLLTPKSGKNMKAATDKIRGDIRAAAGFDEDAYVADMAQAFSDPKVPPKNTQNDGPTNRSIVLSKLPTKRLEKSIALYMPPTVEVGYTVKYSDDPIGALAMAGTAAIDAFKNEKGNTEAKLRAAAKAAGPAGSEFITSFLEGAADAVAPGAQALAQLERGTVITPRMEMMLEGVGRRSFTYTFAFIPKSKQEALIVEEIIQHFKFYMMPAYSNPNTKREMDIPGTFDIQYMYRGSENSFINKVSTCFLTEVKVQYGADRYTAYEEIPGRGSPPQKSSITLNFSELELMSQQHIAEGH